MAQSLYERLGEADGISALVDDIVEAHMENPIVQARFQPYRDDAEDLERLKSHLCDFLAEGVGGPEDYTGRSMPEAHRGMNISRAEYMAVIDDILETLEEHGIDASTRNEILVIAYSLKDEIIHV